MIDTDKIVSGLTYNGVPLQMAGSGPVDWGEIGGDIADQEDLYGILEEITKKSDLPINVKNFGAVGDGVADDTEAVQNALNAAEGKTLVIDGVCKITESLVVKDNTVIIGIGSKASGFDSYVTETLFTSANANGIYKCLFKNLKIRNRNLAPTDTDGQYIGNVFSSLYESRITECYIEHFAQICDRMARISLIDHCEIYYTNKSLVNDVIDSMIESNYINARNTAADRTIMVYGLFSNSMFANNFCDYWGTAFRLEAGSKPSNVIGNTFDNCVSVFRDYVTGLSIVGNNYTNIKYVSANWQAGGQPSAAIQATKWSVFKFDGATVSHTGASAQCSLMDITFSANTFGNCSYYIAVENGTSVYPVQRCNFSHNAWEGLLVDAAFTNPQSAYDNGGMRTVYFDFWEGQSVDALPSANLISNAAKSVATYDGMTLWYKKREIRNFNGAWRFADGSVLSNEIWDLADRTYLSRTVVANTPRNYSADKWYKVGYNGAEYTDAGYADNPIVSNITKNGFTIQTKSTLTGLGFYLPHGTFTFSATLQTGIEAYLLVVPASGTLESRNQVASGATLNCNDASKDYVLLFCSRTTIGTYTVSNISIRDNSYAEVSTAPFYTKEESQTKSITDSAGYFTTDTVEGALAEIGDTLDELADAKQDKLIAGEGITITADGKTISASGGATFTPSVDASGNISWTNDKGLPNPTTRNIMGPQGNPGNDGVDGEDGHTPTITATKSGTTTTIKSDGVAIATINDGAKGDDGEDGADGHSPVVTASKSGTVTTIKVDGTTIATINDGEQGPQGPQGSTGAAGHTPVKGTDYWTAADRQGIINDVLAAIPIYGGAIV